jgi:hypothetical protein
MTGQKFAHETRLVVSGAIVYQGRYAIERRSAMKRSINVHDNKEVEI